MCQLGVKAPVEKVLRLHVVAFLFATKKGRIMDEKFIYISRTLSRTKRKDFENYVINAVWNRLECLDLKPVSQQYILRPNKSHYFIDLYFPQLNIGIECDEGHHKKNSEQDKMREVEIIDILKQVTDTASYKALHIDVTKSFEDIENQINECVEILKGEIAMRKNSGTFEKWADKELEEYFVSEEEISVDDDIVFRTSLEACNILFGTKYKRGVMINGKQPGTFKNRYPFDNRAVCFVDLTVEGGVPKHGWHNELSNDGKTISIYQEGHLDPSYYKEGVNGDGIDRIFFTSTKDPLTNKKGYRFVGIFRFLKWDNKVVHERISDKCELIKNVQK